MLSGINIKGAESRKSMLELMCELVHDRTEHGYPPALILAINSLAPLCLELAVGLQIQF